MRVCVHACIAIRCPERFKICYVQLCKDSYLCKDSLVVCYVLLFVLGVVYVLMLLWAVRCPEVILCCRQDVKTQPWAVSIRGKVNLTPYIFFFSQLRIRKCLRELFIGQKLKAFYQKVEWWHSHLSFLFLFKEKHNFLLCLFLSIFDDQNTCQSKS